MMILKNFATKFINYWEFLLQYFTACCIMEKALQNDYHFTKPFFVGNTEGVSFITSHKQVQMPNIRLKYHSQ
jgi:hypothetical protein